MDKPSGSRRVNIRDPDFQSRIERMLHDDFSEDESCGEEIDDSDADPDYVVPNEDREESSGGESDESNALLEDDAMEYDENVPQAPELPEYVFGRLKKKEFGPPYWWTTVSGPRNVRTPSRNIIRGGLPGLKGPARALGNKPEKTEVWNLLFDEGMLNTVVNFTNQKLSVVRSSLGPTTSKSNYRDTDSLEINAYLGLQLLASILKTNHEDMTSLFSKDVTNRPYFTCTMSEKRYEILTSCLRFDDSNTREQRKQSSKAAAISEIFDKFIENSQSNYSLSEYLTIDEMLVPFRGRCAFRVYMPKKPSKYGIKVQCLCDARTSYLYNAYIYTGKDSDGVSLSASELQLQKPTQTVVRLCQPVEHTNRNVTCDNYFTSIESVDVLTNKKGLTMVGTLRKDKHVIPKEFLPNTGRPQGSSYFAFNNNITLVSFVPKQNRAVVLISSMHHGKEIDLEKKKPEIISFYNKTKCGVDLMDMKCAIYGSNRRTRRWPLAMFYRLLNVCSVNAFILYLCYKNSPVITRFTFLKELAKDMIVPHMRRRLEIPNLPRAARQDIVKALGDASQQEPRPGEIPDDKMPKRKTCSKCPSVKERKTAYCCIRCLKPICLECSRKVCVDCAPECV